MKRVVPVVALVAALLMAGAVGLQLFSSSQPTELEWLRDYAAALERARSDDLPILAYLHTDWCGFCRRMNATTLVDPTVISEVGAEFVWLKLNAEKDVAGIELRDRFGINAYPAMILLDADGQEIDRLQGYITPERFPLDLRTQLHSPASLGALRRAIEENPNDIDLQYQMGRKLLSRNSFGEAVRHFSRVLDLDPENSRGFADAGLFFLGRSLAQVGENDAALSAVKALEKRFPDSAHLPDAMVLKAELLLVDGQTDEASEILKAFLTDYPDHRYTQRIREFLTLRAPAAMPVASH